MLFYLYIIVNISINTEKIMWFLLNFLFSLSCIKVSVTELMPPNPVRSTLPPVAAAKQRAGLMHRRD